MVLGLLLLPRGLSENLILAVFFLNSVSFFFFFKGLPESLVSLETNLIF